MSEIDNYRNKKYSGREARLFREWEMLNRRFEYGKDNRIMYMIRKRNFSGLPTAYEIHFHIRTITGVNPPDEQGLQTPVFGDRHILRINLPNNYPSAANGKPVFMFSTDVWHPNIRFFGDFKGRVCLNYEDSGMQTSLVAYIDRVTDYLTYDDYHAKSEEYPYPEDLTVAEWVLNQAEPNQWLNFSKNLEV
jgi:hypothetical protein